MKKTILFVIALAMANQAMGATSGASLEDTSQHLTVVAARSTSLGDFISRMSVSDKDMKVMDDYAQKRNVNTIKPPALAFSSSSEGFTLQVGESKKLSYNKKNRMFSVNGRVLNLSNNSMDNLESEVKKALKEKNALFQFSLLPQAQASPGAMVGVTIILCLYILLSKAYPSITSPSISYDEDRKRDIFNKDLPLSERIISAYELDTFECKNNFPKEIRGKYVPCGGMKFNYDKAKRLSKVETLKPACVIEFKEGVFLSTSQSAVCERLVKNSLETTANHRDYNVLNGLGMSNFDKIENCCETNCKTQVPELLATSGAAPSTTQAR